MWRPWTKSLEAFLAGLTVSLNNCPGHLARMPTDKRPGGANTRGENGEGKGCFNAELWSISTWERKRNNLNLLWHLGKGAVETWWNSQKKIIIANSEHWLQTKVRKNFKLRGGVKNVQPNDSYADNNIAVQNNGHDPAADTAQILSPGPPPTCIWLKPSGTRVTLDWMTGLRVAPSRIVPFNRNKCKPHLSP